ncbi:unnamed protein product [Protopolystoma xenopodis]|uniref:Uncharacterized protein n=1 Tax=Protopolystoma xenopodis TaxID=117903 RepID=A0A448WBT2_9PLAT|nr:unnamed protein product [Protopolystoma xenopodis]
MVALSGNDCQGEAEQPSAQNYWGLGAELKEVFTQLNSPQIHEQILLQFLERSTAYFNEMQASTTKNVFWLPNNELQQLISFWTRTMISCWRSLMNNGYLND